MFCQHSPRSVPGPGWTSGEMNEESCEKEIWYTTAQHRCWHPGSHLLLPAAGSFQGDCALYKVDGGIYPVITSRVTGTSALNRHLLKMKETANSCQTQRRKGVSEMGPRAGLRTEETKRKETILAANHLGSSCDFRGRPRWM